MTWGIRLLRLFVTLALGVGALVGVPALTGTAGAAPATCTTTYSVPGMKAIPPAPTDGFSYVQVDIQVPDSRVVVDVDWGFDIAYSGDSAAIGFEIYNPQTVGINPRSLTRGTGGPLNGTFVMDDEAPTPFVGVSPGPGRYRPSLEPATRVEGASGNGVWRMFVTNSRATTAGTWGNATLTLTVDCDADQDGVADATDNCQATANTDQANTDDDALGDACDLDVDGDNLANAADRCPRAAAATTSGCPAVGRTASLRYAKATRKLKAVVRSDVPGCRSDAAVTLYRAKRGKDTKLVVGTTNSNGRWTRKAPKVAGRYYVKVATSLVRGEAECGRAKSKKARMSLGRTTLRTALVDTDGDGLDDTRDGCPTVAASTSTGCPVASRKVALNWLAGKQRLQVQVSSPVGPCAQRARIALFRVRPNKDFKVFGGSTSFGGRLRVKVARGATYYATVPLSYSSGVAECGKAESRRVLAPRG